MENKKHKDSKKDYKKEEKIKKVEQRIKELEEKLKDSEKYQGLYIKKTADFDNYMKRYERERSRIIKLANEDILLEILPVVDNFERALATPAENLSALHDGIELILKQLETILDKAELKKIKSIGEKFDPVYHHAIGVVEEDEIEDDIVVEEVLPGYTLFEKVIRPSMVKVSRQLKEKDIEPDGNGCEGRQQEEKQ
ncbi:MAG: nucleotide exchange factor GrpE [Candidatus Aureabacteria bacterium]|nr:nucleotide exchange factor GrpE [Candidatus Auribacterota bacterium]